MTHEGKMCYKVWGMDEG